MMKIGTFHTPPRNQGQIVDVSYTQIDGLVIRQTLDRSDRSVLCSVLPEDWRDGVA